MFQIQSSAALNVLMANKILNYPIIRSPVYKLGDLLNMIQVDVNQVRKKFKKLILKNKNNFKKIGYCIFLMGYFMLRHTSFNSFSYLYRIHSFRR
jgi:hypothetical protein